MKFLKAKISIIFDYLKDIIIFIILVVLIILVFSTIIHNILKIGDLLFNQYTGEYKNVVILDNGDEVNLYQIGEANKTIVILPGYGVHSPVIMYKNLAERLKDNYKVVIIEYPGYGFCQNAETERTNENIAIDIKLALEMAQINGPYILMPNSISNIYAMKFVQLYPDLVETVISIDGEYPSIMNEQSSEKIIDDMVKNIRITSIIEYTGFARILSYTKPNIFYLDMMEQDEYLNESDIKLYRKMIAMNYLTRSMVDEIKNVKDNMIELKDFQYPENLPVLEILSDENVKYYDETYSSNKLRKLAKNTLTNFNIQKVIKINGIHMLNLSSADEIVSNLNKFIASNL